MVSTAVEYLRIVFYVIECFDQNVFWLDINVFKLEYYRVTSIEKHMHMKLLL